MLDVVLPRLTCSRCPSGVHGGQASAYKLLLPYRMGRPGLAGLLLLVVAQALNDREHLLKCDEPPPMADLVLVDGNR